MDRLPHEAFELLRKEQIRKNLVVILSTVDAGGFPHIALLSPYQVVAISDKELGFCVHKGTTTDINIKRSGLVTFVIFIPPAAYYVKARAIAAGEFSTESAYRAGIEWTKADYAEESPITASPLFDEKNIKEKYLSVFAGLIKILGI